MKEIVKNIYSFLGDTRRRGSDERRISILRREERPKATPPFDFAQGHELVEW